MPGPTRRLRAFLARLRAERRGVAAVEFALVLPFLIVLYFGVVELTRVLDMSRKLTLFSRSMADLSGRADNPQPTNGDMTTIASAAGVVLRPFNAANVQIVVSAMGVESFNGALYGGVCSSWQQNATARPKYQFSGTNGLPPTPATYQFDGARYILAEVTMAYTPLIGASLYRWIFGGRGLTFTRQIPWAERTVQEIVMPGGSTCPKIN